MVFFMTSSLFFQSLRFSLYSDAAILKRACFLLKSASVIASRFEAIDLVESIDFIFLIESIMFQILKSMIFALYTASQTSQSLDMLNFRTLLSSVVLLDITKILCDKESKRSVRICFRDSFVQ